MSKYRAVKINKQSCIDPTMADDPTFINYLALAAAILDTNNRRSEYYLKGLQDKEEGDTRMQEIDNLRKMGFPTESEHENDIEKMLKRFDKSRYSGIPVVVTNDYTGEVNEFGSLKEACDEYDLKYDNVKQTFYNKKQNEIKYQGLIMKKLV